MDGDLTYANRRSGLRRSSTSTTRWRGASRRRTCPCGAITSGTTRRSTTCETTRIGSELPDPATSPGAPALGCCGEDWSWFDAAVSGSSLIPSPTRRARGATGRPSEPHHGGRRGRPVDQLHRHLRPLSRVFERFHPGDDQAPSILDSFGATYRSTSDLMDTPTTTSAPTRSNMSCTSPRAAAATPLEPPSATPRPAVGVPRAPPRTPAGRRDRERHPGRRRSCGPATSGRQHHSAHRAT